MINRDEWKTLQREEEKYRETKEYWDVRKLLKDAGLIDYGSVQGGPPSWIKIHYEKIADLLAEVKQLRGEKE